MVGKPAAKAMFWDFDGTLTYADNLWSNAVLDTYRYFMGEDSLTLYDIRPLMWRGYTWDKPYDEKRMLKGEAWWEFTCGMLAERFTVLGAPLEKVQEMAEYAKKLLLCTEKFHIYEDAPEVLASCIERGYRNYIVSNHYPELPQLVEKLGLAKYFSGYAVSSELGIDKPRPEIFEYAKELAGNPEICYMVGDNPHADIKGAESVGIPAILVHREPKGEPKRTARNLREVLQLIDKEQIPAL